MRIVTTDDNYLVREGVRRLLEDSGDVLVEDLSHRRVTAVLAFLRDAGLGG